MKPLTITVNPIPRIVRIDLHGHLSAIPSITNRRIIRGGRLIKDPKAASKLDEMSWLFVSEAALIKPLVQFGIEPVHVLVILGERYDSRGRKVHHWDSHNMAKAAADWLQAVEVIEDDEHAEVCCVKRKDYFGSDEALTSIIVQPRTKVQHALGRLVHTINEQSLTISLYDEALPEDLVG